MLLRKGCLPAISRATECPYWPRTAEPRKKSCHDLCVLRNQLHLQLSQHQGIVESREGNVVC